MPVGGGGGGGDVLPLGFGFERAIDKRAPLGRAATDVVEKIMVSSETIVGNAAK